MKKYKFSKEQIKELEEMEFSVEVIGVGNSQINYYADIIETLEYFTLEEIIDPLERGDKVRFRDYGIEPWNYGWFSSKYSRGKIFVNVCGIRVPLLCETLERYEWTEAELKSLTMGETK